MHSFLLSSVLTYFVCYIFQRFFGIMRNSCGSNDHADPVMFLQVFRLLCCYSLVKPPKGPHVTGTELLETFMNAKNSINSAGGSRK